MLGQPGRLVSRLGPLTTTLTDQGRRQTPRYRESGRAGLTTLFKGNFAYILGWSLADGLYPILTLYGLRLLAPRVPGLVTV